MHQGYNDTSTMPTELSHKQNTIIKRININKSNTNNNNNNNNASDVVSNQSIINNNINNLDDLTINKTTIVHHSSSDSDNFNNNNNNNARLNDKTGVDNFTRIRLRSVDGESTKAMNAVNNVNKTVPKLKGNHLATNYQHQQPQQQNLPQPGLNNYDSVNCKNLDEINQLNDSNRFGSRTMPSTNKYSSNPTIVDNDTVARPTTNYVETRLSPSFNHNHDDIVNYVVSGMYPIFIVMFM